MLHCLLPVQMTACVSVAHMDRKSRVDCKLSIVSSTPEVTADVIIREEQHPEMQPSATVCSRVGIQVTSRSARFHHE